MRCAPALLLGLVLAFCVPATARGLKGPGPFSNIQIRDGQLIFDVKQGGGLGFSGTPKVFAAVRSTWVPISVNASIRKDGSQLVQRGDVGGVPIDEFFKDGDIRRILVRNGSGGETELDLYRIQNGFLQAKTNRAPAKPVAGQAMAVVDDIDADRDRSITIGLERPESPGFDVVIASVVPDLDSGINSQGIRLVATDLSGGRQFFSEGGFATSGDTLYRHIYLPAGSYEISVTHTLEFGNPLVATGSVSFVHRFDQPITVGSSARLFEYEVPHDELPASGDATLSVLGLEQLAPSVGSPLAVAVNISSTDGTYSINIQRDALVATPLTVTVPMPETTFAGSVSVSKLPDGPNTVGHSEVFGFQAFEAAPEVALSIPLLARVSGTILDPNFSLVSTDDPGSGPPAIHQVFSTGTMNGGSQFYGAGIVRGFARGFSFFVPRGSSATVRASLDIALGEHVSGNDFSRNDHAYLELPDVADGVVEYATDIEVDVPVPQVARPVTISGTVVDKKGKPVEFAFVAAISSDSPGGLPGQLLTYVGTGKDGRFSLRLPRGAHYLLTAYGQLPGF